MTSSLLSTGKKKAKASRVFGGDVFNEGGTSLCYSPSPRPKMMKPVVEQEEADPTPTILFGSAAPMDTRNKQTSVTIVDKENTTHNVPANANVLEKNSSAFQSMRNAELSRLRAIKSPLRSNLADTTQKAVDNASSMVNRILGTPASINQSLNASRKSKKAVLGERTKKTKMVRFQRDEEKNEAKVFYNKVEQGRRQLLAVQRTLASAHFKEKARKDDSQRMQRIADLDKDSQFNSRVFRDHQKKLKEERDKNRKKSMNARSRLRQNRREGEEKLETMRRDEEAAIFEVRYDLHRARNEVAKASADDRRKSFQFRAGDAKRIQNIRSSWREDDLTANQKSFELSTAAARDVDENKKKMAAERRASFKSRNLHARRGRHEEENHRLAAINAEHESYELKWAGEKDTEAYRKQLEETRRKSIAGRNKESARHAQAMQEIRNLNSEKEAESFMLEFAAENDAKEYMAKLAKERRESLQLRGHEATKRRQYDGDQHREAVESAFRDGALQSECHKDIESYRKETAEKARKSLQFRGKEKQLRRLEEENQRQKQQTMDHGSFELDSMAHMDVEEYLIDCKRRRRKSLAFRAKEKRRHAAWRRCQEEKEIEARQESSHLQSLDYQYMALAQQQERARIAMDALRSAGCTIKGNPFGDLLGA